jgi:hypothetical protein
MVSARTGHVSIQITIPLQTEEKPAGRPAEKKGQFGNRVHAVNRVADADAG